jgi:hypothetical protein
VVKNTTNQSGVDDGFVSVITAEEYFTIKRWVELAPESE